MPRATGMAGLNALGKQLGPYIVSALKRREEILTGIHCDFATAAEVFKGSDREIQIIFPSLQTDEGAGGKSPGHRLFPH